MDVARDAAERGAEAGYVVHALEQQGGRGRFGNAWASPPGNLYLTLVLRPETSANRGAQLAFVMALAVLDTCAMFGMPDVQLKWPNDVLQNGKKCAGILLEQSLMSDGWVEYLLVGVGLNVLAPPEGRASVPAPSVDAALDVLLAAIQRRYLKWANEGFPAIREKWLAHAYGLNQPMTARMAHRVLTGTFHGLDDDGTLLLATTDGIVPITGAEIHFDSAV